MLAIFGPVALALVGTHAIQWGLLAGAGDVVGSQHGEIPLWSFATYGIASQFAIIMAAERQRVSPAVDQLAASRIPPAAVSGLIFPCRHREAVPLPYVPLTLRKEVGTRNDPR